MNKIEFITIYKDKPSYWGRKDIIEKQHPDIYQNIIKYPGRTWSEQLYCYIHNITEVSKCPICGKLVKFRDATYGYGKFCGLKCMHMDKMVMKKIHQTKMKRYGSISYNNREKASLTNMSRYGTETPLESDEIKEKIKKTNLERYGVETPLASKEIREKIKETNINRYGYSAPAENSFVLEKMQQTCRERYDADSPLESDEIKEKIKKTNLERYGTENPLESDEIKEKIKKTNLERYGTENPLESDEIKEKIKEKNRKNNIARIDNLIGYTSSGDWICECPHLQCNKCSEKFYIIPKNHQPSTLFNCRKRYDTELCTRLLPIQPLFSSYELLIRSWLDEFNIVYNCNDRSIISPLELDIYIPKSHLAIEINGCYWHSNACKPKSYHMDKWAQCKDKGIKMITFWEDWIQDHPTECKQLIMYHLGMINTIDIPWDHNLVDLGLESGSIKEHISIHNGYECWDCGIFFKKL